MGRPLRVALDVTPEIIGVSGLRHYATVTREELQLRKDIEVLPFAIGRGAGPGYALKRFRLPVRTTQQMWRFLKIPAAEMLVPRPDLVHSLDMLPPPTRRPLVVTVMDIISLTHPHLVSPRNRELQEAHLKGARRATAVVTGCAATAEELVTVGIRRDRIFVTPFGRRPAFDTETKPIVDGPYILSVSTVEPRKGYEILAGAAALIPDCPPILIAGPDGWEADAVRRRVREVDTRGRVRFLGDISDGSVLQTLYRNATLVCQPTLAEGFGFPLLEAMGYGAAVVGSDIPQAREVCGGCALLVPPGDAEALAAALTSLLDDTAERNRLGALGASHAASQTWQRTTEHLVAAYRQALEG